ncbi:MAG TPA: gamma-glutamylcyclotransferase family protein [Polyangiaceae bacterium]|nr:gamma-glutamylcyclotransferase family protein [Polyangiaceae bacterium]
MRPVQSSGERGKNTQSETLIFVYGTLRRGEANHALLGASTSRGPGLTRPQFELFDLGEYPGMAPEGTTCVVGEVYAVSPETLRRLDRLERHPTWYERKPIQLSDGLWVEAYVLPRAYCKRGHPIASGDWLTRGTGPTPTR